MHADFHPLKNALLSVTDKTNLETVAKSLIKQGVTIYSSGGTAKFLEERGVPVTPAERLTKNPEAFGGRMKTISFQVSSGLLFRRHHETDIEEAKMLGITAIDLVICNLYPFEKAAESNSNEDILIENIDVGGPTMIRSAAKNYESVTVLTDVNDYERFLNELTENNGKTSFNFRREMSIKAFSKLASYDSKIAEVLSQRFLTEEKLKAVNLTKKQDLRYGENPHQKAALYTGTGINLGKGGIANAKFLQGKELSYNNFLDADAAWKAASDFLLWSGEKNKTAVSVVKHANPIGLALSSSPMEALELAWKGDEVSSFGGILSFTSIFTEDMANFLNEKFIEVIIAPEFTNEALNILSKKKNVRVLTLAPRTSSEKLQEARSVSGGLLIQDVDSEKENFESWTTPTKIKFAENKLKLARLGVAAAKYLKSNAIALVAETASGAVHLAGAGMGQPNRLDSLRMLCLPRAHKKETNISEAVLVSDAFFPFRDNIDEAHRLNVKFIVQPGGSIKDKEVIEACDELGIAMVLTKTRHFYH